MESIVFLTTFSAFLTTPYITARPKALMSRMKEHGNKLSRMKESQTWFTIKLDDQVYRVHRVVQSDESVVFIVDLGDQKIKLFRDENDNWIGDAEQHIIDSIGRAIEEA